MVDFISRCYEEYKTFMDLKLNMPNILPIKIEQKIDENGKTPLAYINVDEINECSIDLYYNKELFDNHKSYIKAILFHEFTHILDGITLKDKYTQDYFFALMTIYSEYHASQIEMACKVGFRNIHSFHKINLDKTFVYCGNKTHNIRNDYIDHMGDSLVIIDRAKDYYYKLSCIEYFRYYKTFESKTMYYLGKKNFCSKYSLKKEADITKQSYGVFYPCIYKIEECIKNNDLNNVVKYKNLLWNQYLNTFHLNDNELKLLLSDTSSKT